MPTTDFDGRIVAVTGAGAGIGRATAEHLAGLGAVVFAVDRDPGAVPTGAVGLQADVTDDVAVQAAFDRIRESHGSLDVLVNNAGISQVGTVEDGPLEDWSRLYDVNVLGYVRCIRAALPLLRRGNAPTVINMSSCTAATGIPRRVAYSATKGAITAMTRALAADLVTEGIRVNAVEPGTVDTPFMAELAALADDPAARRAEFEARQPTGRMVAPEEIARAVAYLAGPGHSAVGSVLTVDGGLAGVRLLSA